MINILLHEFRDQGYILGMTQDFCQKASRGLEERKGVKRAFWPGSMEKLVSIRTLVSVLCLTYSERFKSHVLFPILPHLLFLYMLLPTLSSGVNCLLPGPGSARLCPRLASHLLQHLPYPCSGTFRETILVLRPSPRPLVQTQIPSLP